MQQLWYLNKLLKFQPFFTSIHNGSGHACWGYYESVSRQQQWLQWAIVFSVKQWNLSSPSLIIAMTHPMGPGTESGWAQCQCKDVLSQHREPALLQSLQLQRPLTWWSMSAPTPCPHLSGETGKKIRVLQSWAQENQIVGDGISSKTAHSTLILNHHSVKSFCYQSKTQLRYILSEKNQLYLMSTEFRVCNKSCS